MELDFTGLARIAQNTQNKPAGSVLAPEHINTPDSPETGLEKLQREADIEARERELAGAVYKEYQQNKAVSCQIQTELLIGTRAGENLTELYLKAVKAISLLTHNELLYRQIKNDLKQRERGA